MRRSASQRRTPLREAARPFQARLDAVHAEIKGIEAVVGKIMDDPWRGEGDAAVAGSAAAMTEPTLSDSG